MSGQKAFAVLLMTALGTTSAGAAEEDIRLAKFFKNYLEEEFRHRPIEATRLGDPRHDDKLDDLSPKACAAGTERTRKTLAALAKEIDYKKLSRAGQIDFEILQHNLTRSLWLDENLDRFVIDPRVYNEIISDAIYLPLTQSTRDREAIIASCIKRMARFPAVVKAAKESLDPAKVPAVYADTAMRQNQGAIRFYESGLLELTGATPQKEKLREAAVKVAETLKEYQEFLEKELSPKAKGEWRIGKEKFARKLELELEAGRKADEVLKEAEEEFVRVRRDLYVLARQAWGQVFPKETLPPDDAEGRRVTVQRVLAHYNRDHGDSANLVRDIKRGVEQVKAFIKEKDILRLPDPDRCQVMEMPEFQRGNSVAFMNNAPPLDPRAASVYAISPPPLDWDDRRKRSYLEEYNAHMLLILTIHEAYPGHYVQLEYSNRHPSLLRRVLFSGVFAEGWAVYTEQMMLDQGFGEGSIPLRLNQLKFYLRAVANTILDHKMHCANMTDAEALKFLTEEAFQSEGEALGKIVRAKQSSCQLSTYFVGRMAFYRLRQEVQREMGEKFKLGRYHEAALAHGTLPVKYLPELVRTGLRLDTYSRAEDVTQGLLREMTAITLALESVQDKETARVAAPGIEAAVNRMQELKKKADAIKGTKADQDKLEKEYMPKVLEATTRMQKAAMSAGAASGGEPTFLKAVEKMKNLK